MEGDKKHYLVNVLLTEFGYGISADDVELKGMISALTMNFEDKRIVVRIETDDYRVDCTITRMSRMYQMFLGVMSQLRPNREFEIVIGGYKQDGIILSPVPVDTENEKQFDLLGEDFAGKFRDIYFKKIK